MGNKFLLLWLLLIGSAFSVLNAAVPHDSLQVAKKQKARFVFNFDTRYTLFDNEPVRVNGLKTGIEWHSKFRTGIGYYFLRKPIVTHLPARGTGQQPEMAHVQFYYGAVYGEYVLLKNPKWELSLPVQAGFGKLRNEHRTTDGNLLSSTTNALCLVEPSVAGHYKVFSWAGIGAGLGYRHMLGQAHPETNRLNAPIYYMKVKLFTGELYRQLRSRCGVPETEL